VVRESNIIENQSRDINRNLDTSNHHHQLTTAPTIIAETRPRRDTKSELLTTISTSTPHHHQKQTTNPVPLKPQHQNPKNHHHQTPAGAKEPPENPCIDATARPPPILELRRNTSTKTITRLASPNLQRNKQTHHKRNKQTTKNKQKIESNKRANSPTTKAKATNII
jgi:hypothetical protein